MSTSDDQNATIAVADGTAACRTGWPAVVEWLQRAITERCSSKPILVVECYPGVDDAEIRRELQQRLKPALTLHASTAFHNSKRIETLAQPYLDASKSPIARSYPLTLPEFFDAERLWRARREIEDLREGLVLIVGCGASLIAWGQVLVYADLTRGEAGSRLSQKELSNLGLENSSHASEEKLQIASLVDWPVADRWKRPLITHWDFVLETKPADAPTLFDGELVQRGFQLAVQGPFRLAPQSETSTRQNSPTSSAWPEQSLRLSFGATRLELPALDLVMAQPRTLLGDAAFLRFGFNCPLPLLPHELPASSSEPLHHGEGWSEQRIVLPPQWTPIEARRLELTQSVLQETNGRMFVLKLVDGPKVSVESPGGAFTPLMFLRGQPFIVPAAVDQFVLRPAGLSQDRPWVMLKSFVQTGTWSQSPA